MWKGTEVAVKVIAAEKITKEMASGFQDEVRLPYPNLKNDSQWWRND